MVSIINAINENLTLDDKIIATEFVGFLHDNGFEFYRDTDYWKDKVYYWGKVFDSVCGCTFRFDNPSSVELEFMKMIVEVAKKQIDN